MNQEQDEPVERFGNKHNLKIYLGLLIIIVAFAGLTSFLNLKGYSQDLRSRADDFSEGVYCYKPPDCCVRMASSHDPFECEWPIRGFCTLDICNGIEGKKQRCGWYWIWHNQDDTPGIGTNTPNGYGCMIGDSEATMHPKYSPSGATVTPKPSVSPTPLPTAIPPTSSLPTSTPIIYQPTTTPIPTQQYIPTVSPTTAIRLSVTYPSPTLPHTGGGGGNPVPSSYIQPTANNLQPSSTPKPTHEPIIPKIGKQVNDFWGDIKTNLQKFFSSVLP
jgi:hypothetical protein